VAVLAFRGAVVIQNWNDDHDWNTTKWWTPGPAKENTGFFDRHNAHR